MTTARSLHTATLLPNGKVLIAGGGSNSAELYDPVPLSTFSLTGNMIAGAGGGVLLQNGKVLFLGNTTTSAELYDPSTGTFTATGHRTFDGVDTATLLQNGKVLITAGDADGLLPYSSAELYDPLTGLGAGGHEAAVTAEIYNPSYGIFSSAGNMPGPLELQTATLLYDGRVLIAGGDDELYWSPQTILAAAQLYVPPPDQWQQAIAGLKTAAGTDSYNFWQWDWLWQRTPAFPGAPPSFGVLGSIDNTPGLIEEIVAAGGGNGLQNISAEQWVAYYRQVIATDPWQQAIARMQASAGTDSYNLWQWAWFWERSPTFAGAPAGFGVLGSIYNTPGVMGEILAAGGGNGFALISAGQWVLYYRQATCAGCWDY